jgi:zinc protease
MRPFNSTCMAVLIACAHAAPSPEPVATVPTAAPASPPAVTPDDPFRAKKPAPLQSEPAFAAVVPVQRKLKNGATVLVAENHQLPLVAVDINIQSGVDREPLEKRGLSGFVAEMLLEGTRTRSALDFEIASERLAAQISTGGGAETSTLHLNALKETLPEALELLADSLLHPAFKPEDVERERGLLLTDLEAKKGNPGALARDDFARELWGDKNPWGLPSGGTPQTVRAIAREDLEAFHQTFYVPNNAVITVSGDVTPDEVATALEKALGAWKKGKVSAKKLPKPREATHAIVFTDLPTGSQSQVWTGWRFPKPTSPDILPLLIANNVFGGLFSSRINLNLREEKAFTYGAHSGLNYLRDASIFTVSSGIVAKHTAEAVTEYEKELARLRTDPIGDEEFARSKEDIIRSLPALLETNNSVASAIAGLYELQLPLDYYATLPGRVRSVAKQDVVAAVAKEVHPEQWPVVVVGPSSVVFEGLKGLGIGEVKETAP